MNWDYLQPVKIRFGKGRVSEVKDLAKEMGIKNGLLVADPFFFTNGLAERIVKESEGAIYPQTRMLQRLMPVRQLSVKRKSALL